MEQQLGSPVTLFYSYAHEDEALRHKLEKHLSPLQRKGLITTWHDRQIVPGADWSHIIDHHMNKASIILLLISPNFLASDYCYHSEMQHALERQKMGEALVIPIILCPVDWHEAPFAHLQCLPRDAKPVTEWDNQDAAFRDIAESLRLIIEKQLSSCSPSEEIRSRIKYLNHLLTMYSTVALPLVPAEGCTLQAIFQPLTLRQDPLLAEDLQYERQRVHLGESIPKEEKPVVVARTSEEALQRSPQRHLIILGGPGSGKTTVLQFLVYEQARKSLADTTAPLPILVSLPDLARSGTILQEYIFRLTRKAGIQDHFADLLGKAIEEGQAFICLDSLDEVSPDQRPDTIRTINELAAGTGNTWIVGSRFTEYKGGQFKRGGFTEWELQPMTSFLRRELAKRLFPELYRLLPSDLDRASGDGPLGFVNLLEAHPQAAAWGENPFLFSLAAVVFVRLGMLPTSRAALYQQVVDAVLETRERDPTRRKVLGRVLSDLALELYKVKGRTFSLDDLLVLLPDVRQRQHENWTTAEIARRIIASGVLDVLAYETYAFRHQTFQEYLAAVELAQRLVNQDQALRDEAWAFAWSKRTYSRWTEVLRLMVGVLVQKHRREGAQKAQAWLRDIMRQRTQLSGDPGHLGLALALKSLTELGERRLNKWLDIAAIEEEVARSWVADLLDAATQIRGVIYEEDVVGFTTRRLHALASDIGRLHAQAVKGCREALLAALQDDDGRKREAAARSLGAFGEGILVRELSPAFNHKDSRARLAVMKTAGKRLSQEQLLAALEDEASWVREEVEAILGQQGAQAPIEALQASLDHKNGHVRASAARVLEKLGIPVPLEPLAALLQDDNLDSGIYVDVVKALETVKSQVSAELLLSYLSSGSLTHVAAKALSKLGEYAPVPSLVALLYNRYIYARSSAAVALGGLGELAPVEPLLAALGDEEWIVRMHVAEALGKLGVRVPVEPLAITLFDNDNGHVRRASVEALEKLGERVPIELFIAALSHQATQRIAVQVLEKREGYAYTEALFDHASEHLIRATAIQILGRIGGEASMQFLIEALHDPHEAVRAAAVEALGCQGEHTPIQLLMDALYGEKDWKVRYAAAHALGKLGDRVPLEPLVAALSSTSWRVREMALNTLGQLGTRVPIEVLVKALQDENDEVLFAALNALIKREESVPVQDLITVLLNKTLDRLPRMAAAQLLGKQHTSVSIEPLLVILYDVCEDEGICVNTAEALGNIGQISLEFLMRSLHDANAYLRLMAVKALGRQGKQIAIEPLIEALQDKYESVRETAIEAVELLGIPIPEEASVALLHDDGKYVRVRMWKFLATREADPPVDIFVQALNDVNLDARMEAAEIIGNFGIKVPIESLLMALDDREERVQVAVIFALGKLGTRVPVEPLRAALGNSNARVRGSAVDMLQRNYPEILTAMMPDVIAVLQEHRTEGVFVSLKQCFLAKMSCHLTSASPELLDRLTQLLDWPYWEVQMYACLALGKLRRNIPDSAIRRLLNLRYSSQSRTVRDAANDALADILSLETGIEDDEA